MWIKRDDLTGLGAGGNKVRKLQYTCAAALDKGATTLVTSGAAQSNHARLTAAAACRLGLDCCLVLAGQAPLVPDGNLALEAGAVSDVADRIGGMLGGLAAEGAMPSAYARQPLRLRTDQIGPGYGVLSRQARDALVDAAQCEGVILDPVYTAKALSGLAAAVADGSIGRDDCTVFVHTGGLPGLFGHDLLRDPQRYPH